MTAEERNSSPSIWHIVIGGITLAVAIIGASGTALWAISQTQLASLKELVAAQQASIDVRLKTAEGITAGNDLRLAQELSRRESELKSQLKSIQDELDARRKEFLNEKEFIQFKERILAELEIIKDQLKIIEQTRPTTGELAATSAALRDRIEKLYAQIASIDEYLRAVRPK